MMRRETQAEAEERRRGNEAHAAHQDEKEQEELMARRFMQGFPGKLTEPWMTEDGLPQGAFKTAYMERRLQDFEEQQLEAEEQPNAEERRSAREAVRRFAQRHPEDWEAWCTRVKEHHGTEEWRENLLCEALGERGLQHDKASTSELLDTGVQGA
jgi:hypothetical protein